MCQPNTLLLPALSLNLFISIIVIKLNFINVDIAVILITVNEEQVQQNVIFVA